MPVANRLLVLLGVLVLTEARNGISCHCQLYVSTHKLVMCVGIPVVQHVSACVL